MAFPDVVFLTAFATVLVAVGPRRLARQVAAAVDEINDQFRGDPPSPMHPLPSGDSPWLRRKTKTTGEPWR